jgi:hypothetical protein
MLKTVINKDGAQISAIPPNPYCKRYVKFMRENVIINEGTKKVAEAKE